MSFRPKRSGEPESRKLLIALDSRVRENDNMELRSSFIYRIYNLRNLRIGVFMKRRILIASLYLILSCGISFAQDDFVEDLTPVPEKGGSVTLKTTSANNPDTSSRWLLSVGIRKFSDTRITPLTYTSKDAISIATYFRQDQVPDAQVHLLVDETATKENIIKALETIKGKIAPQDTFLFFFSSHGVGDNAGKTYFVTFDTVLDTLSRTALPMQHIKETVQDFGCHNVVMLADTCHSGGVKSLKQQNEEDYNRIVRAAGKQTRVAILTSSRTHETSTESPQWGHGAFTYYLLEGLAGKADNFPKDGRVSITELFDHVMIAVPRATNRAQHPSGKFSYNWPGKKEAAVPFGRVLKTASPGDNTGPTRTDRDAGLNGDDWNSIINNE